MNRARRARARAGWEGAREGGSNVGWRSASGIYEMASRAARERWLTSSGGCRERWISEEEEELLDACFVDVLPYYLPRLLLLGYWHCSKTWHHFARNIFGKKDSDSSQECITNELASLNGHMLWTLEGIDFFIYFFSNTQESCVSLY